MSKTHPNQERLDFGKHYGKLVSRVPVGYLLWMVNNRTSQCKLAREELARRGTTFPNIEISGHAMDRASQRLWSLYQKKAKKDEGLWSWLVRIAEQALKSGSLRDGRISFRGIKFAFDDETVEFPVLKSVYLNERGNGYGK